MDVRYEEVGGIWICMGREGCIVFRGEGMDKEVAYREMLSNRMELLDRMEAEY